MKNKIIKFPYIFFILLLVAGNIQSLKATHIVGGDMSYRSLGGEFYEITLSLRRDCYLGSPEAFFDPIAHVGIFSANGSLLLNIADNGILKIPYTGNDTLNPFIRSDCGFEGTQVCVQEAVYKGIVRLPFRNGGYIMAYQRCCRNETLANIVEPLRTGATYWIHITQTSMQLKNSSPRFVEWPDVYICANKPLSFDHVAVDPDGDSLVYKLCLPNKGATREAPNPPLNNSFISSPPFPFVTWNPPYGLSNLLGGDPLKIDPVTGELTAVPNLVGQFLVGVCVEEYRDGVLLSEVKRDFQFNVRVCSQPPKAFFDPPTEPCSGLEVAFTNNSLAAGTFRWYFDWPSQDPAFMSTEANPTFVYPESGIYTVKLRATRGSDGCFDSLLQTINVFDNTIVPEFSYRLDECDVDAQKLTLLLTDQSTYDAPGFPLNARDWKIIQGNDTTLLSGTPVQVQVNYTGEIQIELNVSADNGCSQTFVRTLDPAVLVPRTDFSYALENCPEGNVANLRLIDLSVPLNPFGVINTISWIVNGTPYLGSSVLVPLDINTGQVTIEQTVSFVSSCTIEQTKTFNLQTLIPRAKYTFEALGCDSDETVNIKLSYDDEKALGYSLSSGTWTIQIDGTTQMYTGTSASQTIPKDKELSFEFIAVFSNGCTDTIRDAFIPGPYPTLQFNGNMHILCPGDMDSLLLNANPDWEYTWLPETGLDLSDPRNPKVIGTENITYTVTVTDGLCTATGSVEIVVLATGVQLFVSGNENTCDGTAQLTVTGGIGQGIYSWSDKPDNSNVVGTGDTLNVSFTERTKTYYVRFQGESCSTMPEGFTITNQTPSIITPSPYRICAGDSVVISVFNEIPDHMVTYAWQEHPFIKSALTTNQITVKVDEGQVDDFTLYVLLNNQYGCPKMDSVYFTIDQNPVADFSFDLKACGENEICFEYSGTHLGFIQWDFGDPGTNSDISSANSPCYTYPEPGTYLVTLQNLTSICPFKDVQKEIVVNPEIEIEPIPTAFICLETSLDFSANTNIENVTYQWCSLNGVILSEGKDFSVVVDKDTAFILKVTDIYGCVKSDTFEIKMFEFVYDLELPETSCQSLSAVVNLNIDSPQEYSFEWLPTDCVASGASSTSPSIITIRDKTYSVKVIHLATGCEDIREFSFTIPDPLQGLVEGPEVFCYDQEGQISLTVQGGGNLQYTWSPENLLISGQNTPNPIFKFQDNQLVQVIVEDLSTTCKDTFYFTPEVNPPVEIDVDAMPDITVYEGKDIEIFVVDPDDNSTYIWSTGQNGTTITVSPTDNTTYIVTVTDENGCTGTDEIVVEVRKAKCDESDIFVPNAFSPNGDINNPVLYVRSNFIEELDFIIYNRWGEQVFRTNDINAGWDGTYKGQPVTPDAFAYYIKARCVNGTVYEKAGNVTVMR